jgi:hypothetical protein
MAETEIEKRNPGEIVRAEDHNQLVDALGEDLVPRILDGVPTPIAGSLGTPSFPWKDIRFNGVFVQNGNIIDFSGQAGSPYLILDGKKTVDSFPEFLEAVPATTTGNIIAGGGEPNLVLAINGVSVTITSNINITSLTLAPGANNTADMNGVVYNDQVYTKTEGEYGNTDIVIDAIGAEIVTRDNTVQVFSHDGGDGTELFFGLIDISENRILAFKRGIAGRSRQVFSNNDEITLLSGNYVFLDANGTTVFTTTTFPSFQSVDPVSPSVGDFYFNTEFNIWRRFNGVLFENTNVIWLGTIILNSIESIAADSNDFDLAWSELSNYELNFLSFDSVNIRVKELSVAGRNHILRDNVGVTINLSDANDREPGVSETANTLYYIYADDSLKFRYSDIAPRSKDKRRGLYHPLRYWRCIGTVFNDGGSNIRGFIFSNGFYFYNSFEFASPGTSPGSFQYITCPAFVQEGMYLFENEITQTGGSAFQEVYIRLRSIPNAGQEVLISEIIVVGHDSGSLTGIRNVNSSNIIQNSVTVFRRTDPNDLCRIHLTGYRFEF